jgi:hypothetical protein
VEQKFLLTFNDSPALPDLPQEKRVWSSPVAQAKKYALYLLQVLLMADRLNFSIIIQFLLFKVKKRKEKARN